MKRAHFVPDNNFLDDVRSIRTKAQEYLLCQTLLNEGDRDPQLAINLLQSALAAEILCIWRYTMMSVSLAGLRNPRIGKEFQEQANVESKHMRMIAERIVQLGSIPDFSPKGLSSRYGEYGSQADFSGLVAQNLIAEQEVAQHYRDLVGHFAGRDRITCDMLVDILEDETDHITDMQDLLALRDDQAPNRT